MIAGFVAASAVVLMMMGVPIAFALLVPSLAYFVLIDDATASGALQRLVDGVDSFPLLAIPFFIAAGYLANDSGLAAKLFDFLLRALARVRGGLAYVNVLGSFGFSMVSGAASADAAGLGAVVIPASRRAGMNDGVTIGLTATSSVVGPVMPPSVPAIIYGVAAGVPIGAMFLAGIIPALMLTIGLLVGAWISCRKQANAPAAHSGGAETSATSFVRLGMGALPVLIAPVLIIGGIVGGVVTPTEAGAAAAVYLIVLAVLQRRMGVADLLRTARRAMETSASILVVVAASSLFALVLTREQVPLAVTSWLTSATDSTIVFLLLVNVLLLVAGMVMDPISAQLVLVPILLPSALAFEVDPIHFGVIVILNLGVGLLTPPIGLVLYVMSSVAQVPIGVVFRGVVRFLPVLLIVLLLATYIPWLSTVLPSIAGQ